MKNNATIAVRKRSDGTVVQVLADGTEHPIEDRTDWGRIDAMTEAEIAANAAADPDNPPLTADDLARMRRNPDAKAIRLRLHLSQEQFAARFHVPLGTLRDWEQGRSLPDTTARTLLRVIERDPDAVARALAS